MPSFPLACVGTGIVLKTLYASGASDFRTAAARNPSTRREAPPIPSVCERRWKSWRRHGSLKYVVSVWAGKGRVVYAVSLDERSEVKSQNAPVYVFREWRTS